jgi:DNA-binding GntR family transcriptional regulator
MLSMAKVRRVWRVEINIRAHIPAYIQIADAICDGIRDGEWRPDDAIPSLKELIEMTHVSAQTVQNAIKLLKGAGLVYTRPGLGTYVAKGAAEKITRWGATPPW